MTAITYPFSTMSDTVLFDTKMNPTKKIIHTYCIKRLNIKGWQLNPEDIAKQIGCSTKTVLRALWWFRDNGYGKRTNDTGWIVYPSPQIPKNNPQEPIEKRTTLSILEPVFMDQNVQHINKECFKEKEQQQPVVTTPPISPIIVDVPVVVFEEEKHIETIIIPDTVTVTEESNLIFPDKLDKADLKAAKKHIKKAPIELQQDVLFELMYRITKTKISNPIGYLLTLIATANGEIPTFNYKKDKAFMASINKSSLVIKKPPIEASKEDNDTWFKNMIKGLGQEAANLVDVKFR